MIQRIKVHNELNGFKFSMAEFSFFALIVLPFGIYYIFHQRPILGLVALGLICNFAMIIVFSVRSLVRKEQDGSHRDLFNKEKRAEIDRKYPLLFLDTILLFVTLLVPFLLFICVLLELALSNKDGVLRHNP